MVGHHLLGPSSMPRILACVGSLFGPPVKDEPGNAAKEGTSCHDLLELCLETGLDPHDMLGEVVKDANYPVTVEMVEAVQLVQRVIKETSEELGIPADRLQVEKSMSHPLVPNNWFGGTADVLLLGDNVLVVIDLKFGFSQVYADSTQLTAYTLLAAANAGREFERFVQIIVQPRAETQYSRHEPGQEELTQVMKGIQAVVEYLQAHEGELNVGPPAGSLSAGPQCKYCKRREGCPARVEMMGELVMSAVVPHPEKPDTLLVNKADQFTTEQLLYYLDRGEVISEFLKDALAALLQRAAQGMEIPSKKLVAKFSDRTWKDDEEAVRKKLPRMKIGLKAADIMTQKLKSVAQVEKTMKELGVHKDHKEKFEELYHSVCTGVKLVDKRAKGEAIRPETAVEMIARIEEQSK